MQYFSNKQMFIFVFYAKLRKMTNFLRRVEKQCLQIAKTTICHNESVPYEQVY